MQEVMWYRISANDETQMFYHLMILQRMQAYGWTEFQSRREGDIAIVSARITKEEV